jgi:hypothetical protein
MSTCQTPFHPVESTPPSETRLGPGDLAAWLDGCQAELVHPGQVEDRLRRAGWSPLAAGNAGLAYRRRFNEHHLGYTALLVATGVAALAAGSAGHVLVPGLVRPVNRNALAAWLTLLVCALPFAAWAHWWAASVDRDDPVAVWSAPRRTLARVLLWSAGIVGIGRLMIYVGQLMTVLVGARRGPGTSVLTGTLNVLIVISIAVPLWRWAFRFLHRFDREDPTTPVSPRRRATS